MPAAHTRQAAVPYTSGPIESSLTLPPSLPCGVREGAPRSSRARLGAARGLVQEVGLMQHDELVEVIPKLGHDRIDLVAAALLATKDKALDGPTLGLLVGDLVREAEGDAARPVRAPRRGRSSGCQRERERGDGGREGATYRVVLSGGGARTLRIAQARPVGRASP